MLGQGAFGSVYLGLNMDTGELMAVKQIDINGISTSDLLTMENEIRMVEGMSHENIVRYVCGVWCVCV
jgi:serine/threonine protein kinase